MSRSLLWSLVVGIGWMAMGGCGKGDARQIRPAFYHWRTKFQLDPTEAEALKTHGAHRVYLKYFDVDMGERGFPQPMARLEWKDSFPAGLEAVPVVFVTNRTLAGLPPSQIDTLASKVHRLISTIHQEQFSGPPAEIQVDCDWTGTTRAAYFRLLEGIKGRLDTSRTILSATLRMHQLKYRTRSGIPPVHRGMVMLYNTGDLDDPAEENSILSVEDLHAYLDNFEPYPLPLDAALPIFGWSVLIRQGRPIRLMHNLRWSELSAHPKFEPIGPNRVKVLESHYFRSHYVYAGDELRAEAVDANTLLACARLAAQQLHPAPLNIILYHLDSISLNVYGPETLAAVFDAFRHPGPR